MNLFQKNLAKVRFAGLFISLTLFLAACQTQQPVDKILEKFHNPESGYVMVSAHRAGHNGNPENSIAAIQHAIDVGVDFVELDVKVTTDGIVVLNHDRTINRTTTGTGDPEEYSWEELQKFKVKLPDGTITNKPLATFEDALNLVKGKVMVDIDLKTSNLQPVMDLVEKTNTLKQVIFFDSDFEILKEVLKLNPNAMVMPRAHSYETADSALQIFSPPVVHIDDSFYTEKVTSLITGKGARTWINALGDQDDIIRAGNTEQAVNNVLKFGANVVQTDEPEILIPYLKSKGLRN